MGLFVGLSVCLFVCLLHFSVFVFYTGEEWHDSSGNEYDCYWYSNGDNCQVYGDQYENANYSDG